MKEKPIRVLIVDDHEVVRMGLRTLLSHKPGLEVVGEARSAKVIMLTSYADEEAVLASIVAGASGYLLKQVRGQTLVEAIQTVARGNSLLDPSVTDKVLERVRKMGMGSADEGLAMLSEREQRILTLIAKGKTNKEIAKEVFLSDKTVKNCVSSILSKLNLTRRSAAAAYLATRASKGGATEPKGS
ncbi:MAG: response regulator transcription factor [Candidatus Tectomicrobia bacterium]|uniref:Response regulator transcription factor n=1 Tax=Tectimicrobiota bacterium TaxID=2528274 RepID=A0A932GP52_UNCTE|nr:response regulator transcription factor [Candidatus Tectomicrobia bacterium]